MKRIVSRSSVKTAGRIFQWAAATKRALTLDELEEALSYEPCQYNSIPGKKPNGLERLTTWCEDLVQLDEELQIIQFAHGSILQHLLKQSADSSLQSMHIKLEEADHLVGEICVTYLNSNDFRTELIRSPAVLPTRLPGYIIEKSFEHRGITSHISRIAQKLKSQSHQKLTSEGNRIVLKNSFEDSITTLLSGHPFLEYASNYWLHHTRKFREGESRTWNVWKQMILGSHSLAKTPWSLTEFHNQAPIVYKWIEGHDHFPVFLQNTYIAELSAGNRNHLICRYAILGRMNYINVLIQLVQNKTELSRGLQHAALGGHLHVVQRLLDAKADVNAAAAAGDKGRTALQAAAEGGHLEVVQRLLDAKADVNAAAAGDKGRTALQAAAEDGHLEVVQRLLDAKADVNAAAAKYGGRTALQAAAGGGHMKITALLKSFYARY